MVEDATDDRLRLSFDGKPDEAVRDDLKATGYKGNPYPTGAERAAINRAFDEMVSVIEARQGDDGNVVLWNMSGLAAAVPQAQQLSAQQVQQTVDRVLDGLGARAELHDAIEVAPDVGVIAGASLPAGTVPSGGTLGGRIYLFRNGLRDEAETLATIFHEIFHLGLSQRIGRAEYRAAMLPFLSDPLVRQYAKRWRESDDGQHRRTG